MRNNVKDIIETVMFKINLSQIPYVSDEEQSEIEEILKDPDCWTFDEADEVEL